MQFNQSPIRYHVATSTYPIPIDKVTVINSCYGLASKNALAKPAGVIALKADLSSLIPVYLKVVLSKSAFEGNNLFGLMLGEIPCSLR